MSFSVTSSQTALALLTGQTKASSANLTSGTQTGQTAAAKARPPPPPPSDTASSAASGPGAAMAQSVFEALSTNFDANSNGTLSASELGSTSEDDNAAQLFAAMDANGDGEMSSEELGGFLKTVGDALHGAAGGTSAGGPPAGGPPAGGSPPGGPPPGGPPPGGGKDDSADSGSSVSSMLESLIQAQASNTSAALSQTNAALITQFTSLLAQVA